MVPTFLEADAVAAAPRLLGWKLSSHTPEGVASGYIVEVEAYSMEDPASHSFRGLTPRTAPMFERAGTIYVYFTYGMHYCMNIVTGPVGHGQALLIRALEPVEGMALMQARRGVANPHQLTNGPAKLTQALGVGPALTGSHLDTGTVTLEPGFTPPAITQTRRIGITKAVEQPWRFYVTDNRFVSKK
jgi:DNA-3-methyladenine glycosylase